MNILRIIFITTLLFFSVHVCFAADLGKYAVRDKNVVKEQSEKKENWTTKYTFEGKDKPGIYTIDPHIWVYTKEFAKRFGMPDEWISDKLVGVEAAAWRKMKTGFTSCGWGGQKSACKEADASVLELYFDSNRINLPWATWSKEMDMLALYTWGSSQGFLTAQDCELRRKNSTSPVGDRGDPCHGRITRQPLADPVTHEEIFLFYKAFSDKKQGNMEALNAYDKNAFPGLAWMQIGYTGTGTVHSDPEVAVITMETRDAPLGNTIKIFHRIFLPKEFDSRIKSFLDMQREQERDFYKKIINDGGN